MVGVAPLSTFSCSCSHRYSTSDSQRTSVAPTCCITSSSCDTVSPVRTCTATQPVQLWPHNAKNRWARNAQQAGHQSHAWQPSGAGRWKRTTSLQSKRRRPSLRDRAAPRTDCRPHSSVICITSSVGGWRMLLCTSRKCWRWLSCLCRSSPTDGQGNPTNYLTLNLHYVP